MINAYDFDETIYDGDSSVDFYLYCLKRNKKVLLSLPTQLFGLILYIIGIKDKTYFKEKVFSFLKYIENVDDYIKDFWKTHDKKIKKWYLDQKEKSDVIISASPEFLLKPLEKKLKVKVIATKVNKKTGKFESINCHDYEKIKRYEKETKKKKNIKSFYSDSIKADYPMLEYAENAYLVKKDEVKLLDLKNMKINNHPNKLVSWMINLFYLIMFLFFLYILGNVIFNNPRTIPKVAPLVLLGSSILYILFVFALYKLINKYLKKSPLIVGLIFFVLFIIQLIFAYYFVVEPSWDFGSVFQGAILDITNILDINQNDYFYRYTNNFGLAIFLKIYFIIFYKLGFEHYVFLGIVLNIICIDLSIIYLYKIFKNFFDEKQSTLFLILTVIFTPFITYVPIFYTDTISLPFGIAGIYYLLRYNEKEKWQYLLISGLLLGIGCCIKFTIIIVLIGMIVYLLLTKNQKKLLKLGKEVVILTVALLIPFMSLNSYMNHSLSQEKLEKESFPVTHWFMMGLHGVGSFDNTDVEYTSSYKSAEDKKEANIEKIKERLNGHIKNKTFGSFYTGKIVFTWGDGTFLAPEKLRRLPKKDDQIREYIVTTESHKNNGYLLFAQTQWVLTIVFMLIGIMFRKNLTPTQKKLHLLLSIIVFGVLLFFILWESRSRYIVNFLPIILLLGYLGVSSILGNKKEREKITYE